jgi:WD40 repeat protein
MRGILWMSNKFHNGLGGREPELCFTLSLIISVLILTWQGDYFANAQTIAERNYKLELVIEEGHTSAISSVAFSPDRKTLASGSWDNTVKLWNVETGQQIKSLDDHADLVSSVAFSPDGKTLASGSWDNTVKLWSVETGQLIKTLKSNIDSITVTFLPDGKTLASISLSSTITLWNIETGQQIKAFRGGDYVVHSAAISPDGNVLAIGSDDSVISLWNVEKSQQIRSFEGHDSGIYSVAFSPDGKTLASGSNDNTIKLWNAETGQLIKSFEGHTNLVSSVTFSPDGKTLASGDWGSTIKLWNVETGQQIRSFEGHTDQINSVAFSPDGKTLASGSNDSAAKLWNVETGKLIKTLSGRVDRISSVAFSPNGKFLASGIWDNTIKLWNVETGQQIRSFEGHTDQINSVAFSPDGKTLASGSGDGTIKLWDPETGRLINSLLNLFAPGYTSRVHSVAFSSDGKTLASGDLDNNINLWDVETGQRIHPSFMDDSSVNSVAFSSDGKTLASGSYDGSITLWNVKTRKPINSIDEQGAQINSVAFSPNGKTLASGSNTIKLWNVETGQQIRSFKGHKAAINSVAFSPNGRILASGSNDNTVKLWNVETGQQIRSFEGHTDQINSVAFSPDGKTLASGSNDAATKLWIKDRKEPGITLTSLDKNDWVITTPEGRFDTNKALDQIEGLHWIINDETLRPLPLDVFMRQYYEPSLLRRVLNGEQFKALPSIADINRVQPKATIKEIKIASNTAELVDVTVEVENVTEVISIGVRDRAKKKQLSSGVFDVRLFRSRQLVGHSTPDEKVQSTLRTYNNFDEELTAWREANKVALVNGKKTYTFKVKLPNNPDNKQVEFSVYAFNEDRVKSETSRVTYTIPDNPNSESEPRLAYIITFGVNKYDNTEWNLQFAGDDARAINETISAKLRAQKEFAEVVEIPLISDNEIVNSQTLEKRDAIKGNVQNVLELLAGKSPSADRLKILESAVGTDTLKMIRPAQPDDMVLIAFSSHGYADNNGIFYIVPTDIGKDSRKRVTAELLSRSISSDELSLWLRDVDAGEMVIIVDACHSASAVEGGDFKPGPMGSRGLGQLAFDKGMRILTATQSDNVALENKRIRQGLLTYALVRDGIKARQADFKPKDSTITITEWLEYGVVRVPKLYEEVKDNRVQNFGLSADQQAKLVLISQDGNRKGTSSSKELHEIIAAEKRQQPSLFDFTRGKRDVVLIR